MTTRLLLVDATNALMRCASIVSDVGGEPTPEEAEKGVAMAASMILAACRELGATHVVCAFDTPASERRVLYPEYKAHRKGHTQTWIARALIAFSERGLFCLTHEGWEADDVIATLVHRLVSLRAITPMVLSGDSDLLALADIADVYQFGRKGEPRFVLRDISYVYEKYGVAPSKLTDLKALAGEPGDGVPGPFGKHCVAKARKLLAGGGVEDLIRGTALVGAFAERARLAYEVLRLRTDLPLAPIPPAHCRVPPP